MPKTTTTPRPKAITCVQVTATCPTSKAWVEVGSTCERALSLQIQDMVPSRIRASPSVAVALTSASRLASAGPRMTP